MKNVKKITVDIISGANIATVALMMITGFAGYTDITSAGFMSIADLFFPIFLVINIAFLVLWLFLKPTRSLIPIAGLIICYSPVRCYCPLNMSHDKPEGAIKVLSYNVYMFAGWDDDKVKVNPILEYIVKSGADIVCLQEAANNELHPEKIPHAIYGLYQYRDTFRTPASETLMLLSKYPIIKKKHIEYYSKTNATIAYQLKIGRDTVLLVNNHLETVGLSTTDKDHFTYLVKGEMKGDSARSESGTLLRKLIAGEHKRVPEAEIVKDYIAKQKNMPIIVVGDFNSSPLSRTHHVMVKGLTDCFAATATGPGWSYNKNHMYVRIDNIFCSDDFVPYGCKVDKTIKSSDHYPIYTWLKKKH